MHLNYAIQKQEKFAYFVMYEYFLFVGSLGLK